MTSQKAPRYIGIEGPIGVGKTSLAKILAQQFGARLIQEEVANNPFLERFYDDRRKYAFQTQLYFLLSRYRQQRDLAQGDLFEKGVVSVYLQARPEVLLARVRKRGVEYERNISLDYLRLLSDAYNEYFFHYNETPLLVVNTSEIDFVESPRDLEHLIREVKSVKRGTQHYIPLGSR